MLMCFRVAAFYCNLVVLPGSAVSGPVLEHALPLAAGAAAGHTTAMTLLEGALHADSVTREAVMKLLATFAFRNGALACMARTRL